ncbi:MAG: hypothetical protein HY319_12970 [Armatimonadetes bacterium]|nr:hypothetical protein [Armatimonadota bacterium]
MAVPFSKGWWAWLVPALLLLLASGVAAQEYSGMVKMPEANTYLVVHDTKTGKEPPWAERVGVLRLSSSGEPAYQALGISHWGAEQELPSDLEACCPVPGRADKYLVAESGYYEGRFGRVFHLRISPLPGTKLFYGEVLGVLRPFALPAPGYSTPSPDQVEGISCFAQDGKLVLVLGHRGGKGTPGRLTWGALDLTAYTFTRQGEAPLAIPDPQMRACGELHLESASPPTLLSVAASDPGDLGPFHSYVYRAGSFAPDGFRPAPVQPLWRLDGMKVEALSTCSIPGSPLCVGTDDEVYGGVWRPLGNSPSTP